MGTIAAESHQTCGQVESYGWEIPPTDQSRIDRIRNGIPAALNALKFTLAPLVFRSFSAPNIQAFTLNQKDRHLQLALTFSPAESTDQKSQIVLLICALTKH